MDELLKSFILESQELLDDFEDTLLSLEKNFQRETVDKLFRAIHTIKGNSGLFNLKNITDLSHSLESQLNKLRTDELEMDSSLIDIFLTAVDLIRRMVDNPELSGNFDIKETVNVLEAVGRGEKPTLEPQASASVSELPPANSSEPSPGAQESTTVEQDGDSKAVNETQPETTGTTGSIEISPDHLEDAVIQMETSAPKTWLIKMEKAMGLFHYESYEVMSPLWIASRYSILQIIAKKIKVSAELVDQILITVDLSRKNPDSVNSQDIENTFQRFKEILGDIPLLQRPSEHPEIYAHDILDSKSIKAPTKPTVVPEKPKPEAQQEPQSAAPKVESPKPALKNEQSQEPKQIPQKKQAPLPTIDIGSEQERKETHIKVALELIDSLINIAGETIIARNELVRRIEDIGDPQVIASGKKIGQLITRLQEFIMLTRMQPMEITFHKLPRIIRDLERATGKKITLLVEGGDIELDKTLIDSLGDPLMHIIRNSVDHGIEPVDERVRAGKSEAGKLHVKAMLKAGNVTIFIQDDGRGIDLARITEKAIEKGIVSAESAESLADHEVIELIFHPGFSTAEQVTQVSGRGVGMDVVRSNIQKIGGTVSIKTEAGRGTLMTINLPQTLSIITSLVVSSGENRIAVPQQNLERLILLHHNQLMENKGKLFIRLAGQLIPVFNLLNILSQSEETKPLQGDSSHLIIVQSDGQKAGLIVDEIINSEEIVIKPLGSMYSGAQLFSGAAVLGDGSAVLILDIQGFYRFVNYTSTNAELISERISEGEEQENELKKLRYVVFEVNTKQFAFEVDGSCRILKLNQSNHREVLEKKALYLESELIPLFHLEDLLPEINIVKQYDENYALVVKHQVSYAIILDQIITLATHFESVDETKFQSEAIQGVGIFNNEPITILSLSAIEEMAYERQNEFTSENAE